MCSFWLWFPVQATQQNKSLPVATNKFDWPLNLAFNPKVVAHEFNSSYVSEQSSSHVEPVLLPYRVFFLKNNMTIR